jgi:hypothetical protein
VTTAFLQMIMRSPSGKDSMESKHSDYRVGGWKQMDVKKWFVRLTDRHGN